MNTLSKGDILSLQHSVYTALIGIEKILYNMEYVQSVMKGKKTRIDFFREKKQLRYQNALFKFKEFVKEFRVDLINSVAYEQRHLMAGTMSEDRVQSLNSIDMLINQIKDDDLINKLEEHIDSIITDAIKEAKIPSDRNPEDLFLITIDKKELQVVTREFLHEMTINKETNFEVNGRIIK